MLMMMMSRAHDLEKTQLMSKFWVTPDKKTHES